MGDRRLGFGCRRVGPNHRAGFTLIEMIVALAVFAVLGVVAYGGLARVLDGGERTQTQANRLGEVQRALWAMKRDLEQVVRRASRDPFGERRPALESGFGGEYIVRFSRGGWTNPAQLPRAEIQRVQYRLTDEGLLMRDAHRFPDPGRVEPFQERILLEEVEDLEIRFLPEPGRQGRDLQWVQDWPPLANTGGQQLEQLPVAVELTVTLADWGELRRIIRLPGGVRPWP